MRDMEFLTCAWGENRVALAAPRATASDGGPWLNTAEASGSARATCCPLHPPFQMLMRASDWMCWNAKNVEEHDPEEGL